MNKICYFFSGLILSICSFPIYGDIFEINARTINDSENEPTINITVSASNFPDLVRDAIEANGQFEVLDGRAYRSVLNYAGVDDAWGFDINAAGTEAEFVIPIINFERTFIAANRKELYDQIRDFLKNEGADVYRRFMEAMNRKSKVAVSDGNPGSTTAVTAQTIFEEAGFGGDDAIFEALEAENVEQNISLSLMASVGRFSANSINGRRYTLPLGFGYRFNDRVSTKITMPLSYRDVEGSKIYDGSFVVNFPVKVIVPNEIKDTNTTAENTWVSGLNWTLTPSLGLAGAYSGDYAAGGILYVVGLTSLLSYDFGAVGLTMGNSLIAMKGTSIKVDGYEVGGDVDQQILKNGFKLTFPFKDKWVGEAYGIYTNFLQDAAVKNFYTVGAQVGMRLFSDASSRAGVLMLGIVSDIGDDYTDLSVRLGTGFRF